MTFKEIQDAVLALMDESGDQTTVLTNVKTFINSALLARSTEQKWPFMLVGETLLSLSPSSSILTLPADFGVLHYVKDPISQRLLTQIPPDERFVETQDKGDYIQYGDTLEFFKIMGPSDILVNYYKVPARLVADSDIPDFPEKWHELFIWDAIIGLKGYHAELENIEYLLERQRRIEQSLYVSNFRSDSVGAKPQRVKWRFDG